LLLGSASAVSAAANEPGSLLSLLLVQIAVIIVLSRVVGLLFRRISQPLVIGEIVAGILLGPSFLGLLAPELAAQLFPAVTIPYLNVLAQLGLIFFMFLVGLELNTDHLRGNGKAALLVSHMSIIVPYFLGGLLALYLYDTLSSSDVGFTSFALFMGAAMSITAFPVLARILTERRLNRTALGALAITCAAVDDVTAWCLLAIVISIVRSGDALSAIPTVLLAILYIFFMFTVARPVFTHLSERVERSDSGTLSQGMVALIVVGVLCSAMVTEMIGIHSIFGAFLFGAVLPRGRLFGRALVQKTEDFTIVILLPVFFAYTGLRTQIGLLNSVELWMLCALVILVACVGKFGGATLAARIAGLPWRESAALGVLMNTRGLMELIILNIGLDLGVISPVLFTMMVIMALVTTFATSPLLAWIAPSRSFMPEDKQLHLPLRGEQEPTVQESSATTFIAVCDTGSEEELLPVTSSPGQTGDH
jgi:Kef-type K+ transport system membrane component KefB